MFSPKKSFRLRLLAFHLKISVKNEQFRASLRKNSYCEKMASVASDVMMSLPAHPGNDVIMSPTLWGHASIWPKLCSGSHFYHKPPKV